MAIEVDGPFEVCIFKGTAFAGRNIGQQLNGGCAGSLGCSNRLSKSRVACAVDIDDVFRPHGIQRGVFSDRKGGACCIIRTGSVGLGVPADKVESGLGQVTGVAQNRNRIVLMIGGTIRRCGAGVSTVAIIGHGVGGNKDVLIGGGDGHGLCGHGEGGGSRSLAAVSEGQTVHSGPLLELLPVGSGVCRDGDGCTLGVLAAAGAVGDGHGVGGYGDDLNIGSAVFFERSRGGQGVCVTVTGTPLVDTLY